MAYTLFLVALLAVAPATYSWWSGRRILRSLDDPALAELLQARQRRLAQVAFGVVIFAAIGGVPLVLATLVVPGLLVAQYPIRRAVHGDEWSLAQYMAYSVASTLASTGLLIFALLAPTQMAKLVRLWLPGTTLPAFALALGLGALSAIVVLAWNRWFTRIWLSLHRGSPLDLDARHASLLPRFHAVIDRAGDRLSRRPSIHRYGVKGARLPNAFALPSLREPAVAISDTLLDHLDADELTAIFAHEIAHHEYFDSVRLRTRRRGFFVVALLIALLPALLIMTGPGSDLVVSAAFLFVLGVLLVRGQAPKQQQETASDLRAVELTDDPEALIRALTKIHLLARQPRRWAKEVEKAATHPSLARRIQAIRAHAPAAAISLDTPTVIASTTTGSYVVLDSERAYWLAGVPVDTSADLASLRERASSYRAMTYRELSELRLVVAHGQRTLRATDLDGQSWNVDVRDVDVGSIQEVLDAVDSQLGARRAEPAVRSERAARILAAALLIAALLGGGTMAIAIPALATMIAPSTASLAALGAMGATCLFFLGTTGPFGVARDATFVILVGALGLGAAWLAWSWYRNRRGALGADARLAARVMFVLLALAALTTLLVVSGSWTSPRDLASDETALSLAISLGGLGAALLTLRGRAPRLAGTGTALLGVAGLGTVMLAERLWPAPSEIAWGSSRLSLVTTVALPNEMESVVLSPRGTRYLTRRTIGTGDVDDDDAYTTQFTTGDVAPNGAAYTVTALDAALPNEEEMLVLAATGDSLALRLERVHADSAERVVWRRPIGAMYAPALRLLDGGTRWQVSGMRLGAPDRGRLVTLDGTVDGDLPRDADVHRTEFPPDSMRGQSVFTYRDGSRLVLSLARNPIVAMRGRSMLWTTLTAMRGVDMTWHVSRQDRDGMHLLTSLHGIVRCWPAAEEDLAVCVDQSARGVHVMSVARNGSIVDLGMLSRRYQRASASPQGQLVASSYLDHSFAVIDVARRRGVRLALPPEIGGIAREATATSDAVAFILSGSGGPRLAVFRLGPQLQTASRVTGR